LRFKRKPKLAILGQIKFILKGAEARIIAAEIGF
jgi:hypothetical protein